MRGNLYKISARRAPLGGAGDAGRGGAGAASAAVAGEQSSAGEAAGAATHASHGRGVHRIPSLVAGPEAHTHTLGKQASAIPRVSCTLVYMALATPYLGCLARL